MMYVRRVLIGSRLRRLGLLLAHPSLPVARVLRGGWLPAQAIPRTPRPLLYAFGGFVGLGRRMQPN